MVFLFLKNKKQCIVVYLHASPYFIRISICSIVAWYICMCVRVRSVSVLRDCDLVVGNEVTLQHKNDLATIKWQYFFSLSLII